MQSPNPAQVQSFIRLLLGSGGPLAALLVSKGASSDTVNLILTVALAVVPPAISLVWSMFAHTDKATVAAVAAMPAEAKAAAVAKLPESAQADIAAALPDRAVVTAVGAMPGVEVSVDRTASIEAQAAAADPAVPGVNSL